MRILFWVLYLLYLLIPKIGFSQVVLTHDGYVSHFDTSLGYPTMVRWVDTRERVVCNNIPRRDCFGPDPILKEKTSLQIDYDIANQTQKSKGLKGFDRGHMCPAADNQCPITLDGRKIEARKLQDECFFFSNMAPQFHTLNAGVWKKLEERTRQLAASDDSIYVWCGSVGSLMRYGKMTVPEKCWKILYDKKTGKWESYVFPNSVEKPVDLESCSVPVGEIEKMTGFKFEIY